MSELSFELVAPKPFTYDDDESRETVWTCSCFFACRRLWPLVFGAVVVVVVVGSDWVVFEDFCDCFFCCLNDDDAFSSCPFVVVVVVVVIDWVLLLRVAFDCTSEFELSELFVSFDERFDTVQIVDEWLWELVDIEVELEFETIVDEGQVPSTFDWDVSSEFSENIPKSKNQSIEFETKFDKCFANLFLEINVLFQLLAELQLVMPDWLAECRFHWFYEHHVVSAVWKEEKKP